MEKEGKTAFFSRALSRLGLYPAKSLNHSRRGLHPINVNTSASHRAHKTNVTIRRALASAAKPLAKAVDKRTPVKATAANKQRQ